MEFKGKIMNNVTNSDWLSEEELQSIGFKTIGKNVLISKKCSIYGAKNVSIGSNVRIDDFSIISAFSGELFLDGYNHISSYCYINSSGTVIMKMFSGLSSRCSLYSSSDDYSGTFLTNPTVPKKFLGVKTAPIILGRHVIIGTNSCVLPGCELGDGAAVGAFSLVNRDIEEFKIAVGAPAVPVKDRKREILALEEKLLEENK